MNLQPGDWADFSACIEWLFADEADDVPGRIRTAHAAGFGAVEFWRWRSKDIDAIERALSETGIALSAFVAEPMIGLNDPANHAEWLEGLQASAETARRLGAPVLIAQAGNTLPETPRKAQFDAIYDVLCRAADLLDGTGVALGLEALNSRIDHVGYLLDATQNGVDIVRRVGHQSIGLTFDIYHASVMDEHIPTVLEAAMPFIHHVHIADHPGRGAPGTGHLDLAADIRLLRRHGYAGRIGLEFKINGSTRNAMRETAASLSAAAAR